MLLTSETSGSGPGLCLVAMEVSSGISFGNFSLDSEEEWEAELSLWHGNVELRL